MIRPAQFALARAEARLIERLAQLEAQLTPGDPAAWVEYGQLAASLAAIAPMTAPGSARAMTTSELADAFNLKPRTARRKALAGQLPVTPLRLGPGSRSKLRWAAQ